MSCLTAMQTTSTDFALYAVGNHTEALQSPRFAWIDSNTGFGAMSASSGMAPTNAVPLYVTNDGGKSGYLRPSSRPAPSTSRTRT